MPYAILRFSKKTSGQLASTERHNERKKGVYKSNPDIDIERSKFNYHPLMPRDNTYKKRIKKLTDDAGCKVRSNSVMMVETLITASPEFIKSLPPDEQKTFFNRALQFISERVGQQNIISAVVHMDETTPHMHLSFCPITPDKRLSAKDFLGNQKTLSQWQTDYHEYMSKHYSELERGVSSMITKRSHIPTWLLKKGERLDKMVDEIRKALSDIGAFNAGKKRDKALDILQKWYPQAHAFSNEIKKYEDNVNQLSADVRIEKENSSYWRAHSNELEKHITKADFHIHKLTNINKKQKRLIDTLPPEVLERLQKEDKGIR